MIKNYILLCILTFLLLVGHGLCEKISKCSPELENLYNYYYDSGALKVKTQQPIFPDSSDTISNNAKIKGLDHPVEDSSLLDSGITDLTVFPKNKSESSLAKVEIEVQPLYLDARPAYLRTGYDPSNNTSLCFEGDIPYLRVFMHYSGDGTDLNALGVIFGDIINERLVAYFPLSILPQVNSLLTVIKISAGTKVELNSLEGNELSN
ncbi:MAG: hypothetical protein GY865_11480 [candidate division Zixibacteria bacterium]|nr:hypothetical protein [candidate division Zixibacteria bacterium]